MYVTDVIDYSEVKLIVTIAIDLTFQFIAQIGNFTNTQMIISIIVFALGLNLLYERIFIYTLNSSKDMY